ncbi:hypothetical protein [Asanoa iriomotensis]|uniref:Lipoprotein n=1 Tax=Asanoa iriomotensis TaxID=234613 RepID=A0ABQ4CC84_9ACTN|nr:hypothetical protein [Asanoa iriomotensis]GIF60383.1 hypothetical protein Air01nite_64780 [Asanoa iriomotensis]
MRTPKLALAATAVLFALAGCGQTAASGGDSNAASTPADPAARIAAAATTLEKGSYRYSIESPVGKMTGVAHAPSESQQLSAVGKDEEGNEFSLEMVEIGTDRWMKMNIDLGDTDDPVMKEFAKEFNVWRHVSREEAAASFSAAEEKVGVGAADLLKKVTGLKESGADTLTGTLDVLATPLVDVIGDTEELKAMGDKAKAIPVAITLDADGRATSVVLDVPAGAKSPAYKATIGFSDYDKVEAPKPPPADQVKES